MTLSEFLLARIAEDEAVARCSVPGPWSQFAGACSDNTIANVSGPHESHTLVVADRNLDERDAAHIARHNPTRVLAECEAKRQLVEWHDATDDCCEERHGPIQFDLDPEWSAGTDSLGQPSIRQSLGTRPYYGCVTLMTLGAVYADHPDYREEWKP